MFRLVRAFDRHANVGGLLDKIGAGTNMTNQYVIPRGDIDGRKLWGRGSDPRPTVWLKLYRQVGENPPEEVPLPEGEIKQVPSGTGTVTWQNVELTTIRGESYVFSVREVDAHGADWTALGYYKIENTHKKRRRQNSK